MFYPTLRHPKFQRLQTFFAFHIFMDDKEHLIQLEQGTASMNIEEIREYCLSKPGVTESLPFNDTALVFKVVKMFAVLDLSEDSRGLTLKCDPERAIELREQHPEVTPAWHFNKQHWNGVNLEGSVGDDLLKEWIDHSYTIVVDSLPRSKREALNSGTY